MKWFPWWNRKGSPNKARIVVLGWDYTDAVRACRWLDVPASQGKSLNQLCSLRGHSQDTVFYVTQQAKSRRHQSEMVAEEVRHVLAAHAAVGGTVIWMTEEMYR